MSHKFWGSIAFVFIVLILSLVTFVFDLTVAAVVNGDVLIEKIRKPFEQTTVSNVRDVSFTVSWTTNQESNGSVQYGTDPNNLNLTAEDERGAGTNDDTHYVTISGLSPNTTYYFDLISGGTTDNNGGSHYTVTTGASLSLPASDTIYGQVFKADGTTPAQGAIVKITVGNNDNSGSSENAAPLSALVDTNGFWNTNLGNARLSDQSAFFSYSVSGDQVAFEVQGAGDGTEDGELITMLVMPVMLNG